MAQVQRRQGYLPGAHIPGTNYYSNPYQAFDDVSVDPNNSLIVAHGALMFVAFGIAAPLAVALSRYGRGRDWMQSHWWLMLAVGVIAFAAFWLAFSYIFITQIPNFMPSDPHSILGLIILVLFFTQVILGAINHSLYTPARKSTPIQNWVHIVLGYLIILLGGANVAVGIWRYFQWYGLDPTTMWIWLGSFLGWFVIFCGLLAFLGECVYPLFSTRAAKRMSRKGRDAAYEEDDQALVSQAVAAHSQTNSARDSRDGRDESFYQSHDGYSDYSRPASYHQGQQQRSYSPAYAPSGYSANYAPSNAGGYSGYPSPAPGYPPAPVGYPAGYNVRAPQ